MTSIRMLYVMKKNIKKRNNIIIIMRYITLLFFNNFLCCSVIFSQKLNTEISDWRYNADQNSLYLILKISNKSTKKLNLNLPVNISLSKKSNYKYFISKKQGVLFSHSLINADTLYYDENYHKRQLSDVEANICVPDCFADDTITKGEYIIGLKRKTYQVKRHKEYYLLFIFDIGEKNIPKTFLFPIYSSSGQIFGKEYYSVNLGMSGKQSKIWKINK